MKSNKLFFSLVCCITFFLIGFEAFAKPSNDIVKGKVTFTGTVETFVEQDIQFGYNDDYRGWVSYTAKPGQLFFGPAYDINGNLVREGSLLIQMDTSYRISKLDLAKSVYKQNEAALKLAKLNYERYKTLVKTHSVSESDYETAREGYEAATANLESAEASVKLAENILDFCTYRARYDGIVEQVYFPFGWLAGEMKVIKIAMLSPIAVDIKMSREDASKITRDTPIKIYPMDSDKPFGVYNGTIIYTEDGIEVGVDNYLQDVSKTDSLMPMINNWGSVRSFRNDGKASSDNPLMIYGGAIFMDDKGSYVWKLERVKVASSDADYAVLHKIYISDKGITVKDASFLTGIVLPQNTGLSYGDLIVSKHGAPANLKDGEKVLLSSLRYIFMPGDKVKVEIGPISPK